MQDKKIKKIEYYTFNGKIDSSKAKELFNKKNGLAKVEYFDSLGNLVRETSFDKNMKEDRVVETKFDRNNRIIEQQTFQNFYNQPHTKTYLSKYIYKDNLLVEVLYYYGTFDTSGFYGRNVITYNQKKQKIREEYTAYNEDANKGTSIYRWKDDHSYFEDRIDKEGGVEKHFIRLNNMGKKVEQKMNFRPSSSNDTSFSMHVEYTFDQFGNELMRTWKKEGKLVEKTEYVYPYKKSHWTYRMFYENKNLLRTEIRRIEYY